MSKINWRLVDWGFLFRLFFFLGVTALHFLACIALGGAYAAGFEYPTPESLETEKEILALLHVLEAPLGLIWGPGWIVWTLNSVLWGLGALALVCGLYYAARWTYRRLRRRARRPA